MRFKMVHSNIKKAESRVCQPQVCYLTQPIPLSLKVHNYSTNSWCVTFITFHDCNKFTHLSIACVVPERNNSNEDHRRNVPTNFASKISKIGLQIKGRYQGRRQGKSLGGWRNPGGSRGQHPRRGSGGRAPWWGSEGEAPWSWSLFSAKIAIEAIPEHLFPR